MNISWIVCFGVISAGASSASAGFVEFTGSGVFSDDLTPGLLEGTDLELGNTFAIRVVIDTSTPVTVGDNPFSGSYFDSIVDYSFMAGGALIEGDAGDAGVVTDSGIAGHAHVGFGVPLQTATAIEGDFGGLEPYYINFELDDADQSGITSTSLEDALTQSVIQEYEQGELLLSFFNGGAVYGVFDRFEVRLVPAPTAGVLTFPGAFLVTRRRR